MNLKKYITRETVFLASFWAVFEFAGNAFRYYDSFPAWDILTHFLGGALVASVAIIFLLENLKKFSYRVNVIFTLGVGGAWEITEFLIDLAFGTHTQVGLNDTMVDLIMVFSAAVIVNLIHYYTRKGKGK
jgi:hypothetical protein